MRPIPYSKKNELSETLPLLPGKSNLNLNGEIKIDRTIRKGFELNAINWLTTIDQT